MFEDNNLTLLLLFLLLQEDGFGDNNILTLLLFLILLGEDSFVDDDLITIIIFFNLLGDQEIGFNTLLLWFFLLRGQGGFGAASIGDNNHISPLLLILLLCDDIEGIWPIIILFFLLGEDNGHEPGCHRGGITTQVLAD